VSERDLLSLREELTRRDVLVCFNGPVSHGVIEEIGAAARHFLEAAAAEGAGALDVFAVYVELSQNMKAYLQRRVFASPEHAAVTILVSRAGDRYAVTAGNVVATEDLPALLARLDGLAGLEKPALRALHKQRLREGPGAGGGAGVGLIEVALRSRALRYATWPLDPRHTFFGITVTV
jgi:hypothetical protein